MNYWNNKERNAQQAKQHFFDMENRFKYLINNSVQGSTFWYEQNFPDIESSLKNTNTVVLFPSMTTSDALKYFIQPNMAQISYDDLGILNFASYKNPGGKFLEGSSAQEESLCHDSILYNVLRRFDRDYYAKHREKGATNKSLYYDRCILSPRVLFEFKNKKEELAYFPNVITCAAPNVSAYFKYCATRSPEEEIKVAEILRKRVEFILNVAYANHITKLILGAFGCGVFSNDPYVLSAIFLDLLTNRFENCFDSIIFAIPDEKNRYPFIKTFFINNGKDADGDIYHNLLIQAIPIEGKGWFAL